MVYCSTKCQRRTTEANHTRQRVQRNRDYVNAAKSAPCTDCGISYPPYVMDFDHVRAGKQWDISELVAKGRSLALIMAELSLCELVCANCHRARTYHRSIKIDNS